METSTGRANPLKAMVGRLLLMSLGICFPLLMLEGGVRLLSLAPPAAPNPAIWTPHPLFGWWHIPYSGGTFHSDYNEFAAEVNINARGLRDREIGYDNPDDAFRVLSLADSFGEALQVDLEETYHKQLEQRLQTSLERPTQVLNGGVGGWGTDQQAIFYLAEGFRYEPEVVLLAFFVRNDVVNNYGPLEIARNGGSQQKQFFELDESGQLIPPVLDEEAEVKAEEFVPETGEMKNQTQPPFLGLADSLWESSALYRFSVPYLRDIPAVVGTVGRSGILGGEAVVRADHPPVPIPFYVYQSPPTAEFEAAWELTEAILRGVRDEVAQRGSQLVVVLIAAPEQLDEATWQATISSIPAEVTTDWQPDTPNRRLTEFLAAEQIPHLDLLPIFQEAVSQPDSPALHFQHDQHWTPAGHELAAEAIHEFLLRNVQ